MKCNDSLKMTVIAAALGLACAMPAAAQTTGKSAAAQTSSSDKSAAAGGSSGQSAAAGQSSGSDTRSNFGSDNTRDERGDRSWGWLGLLGLIGLAGLRRRPGRDVHTTTYDATRTNTPVR